VATLNQFCKEINVKNFKIHILLTIGLLVWTCEDEVPIMGIHHHELDEPDSPPTIAESNLMDGDDFTTGYYNGKIRSDRVNLDWETSEDENFLGYKIFRASGGGPGIEDISEGFESGIFPSGWTEYGDYGGWYITSEDVVDGNYSIRSYSGNYGYEYLEKTITVPQYSDVFISFWGKGVNDGDGYLYVNGNSMVGNWGYDNYGSYWNYFSNYYYTGSYTQITLQWYYRTENYGYGLLDNIQISGVEGGSLSYSLIETLNDKNTTSFWDTTLTQNQYYTYKVANIVKTGTHKVDDIAIKTPKWQAPDSVIANGLSPTVVELNWKDNTESETAFKIYIDTMDVYLWDYVMVDSTTAGQNDTTKVITGLSETAQYRFSIKAKNSWENDTPPGYSSSFEFQFNPPSNLLASQTSGAKAVSLTWYNNSTLESGFIIERDTTGNDFETLATVASNITSYTDTDTTNFEYGNEITYRIRAYNDYSGTVYSDYSNEASITISDVIEVFVQFTNCGQTGRYGPSQGQCNSEYGPGEVIVNDGIQEWTVPYTGIYTIEVFGAQGGYSTYGYNGGNGARMGGDFVLSAGEILDILVGQKGSQSDQKAAGGGGGTFVVKTDNTPLIIAGAGSGGGGNDNSNNGQPGLSGTSGGNSPCCNGGSNGNGGGANNGSGGGGGFYENGTTGYGSTHGYAFLNGGHGGDDGCGNGGIGGFGGGSGGEWCSQGANGAGGGYSGGAGTDSYGQAGGGGSYNAGTNQDNESGVNEGHGYVIIRNF
jgi:hypothetical protein